MSREEFRESLVCDLIRDELKWLEVGELREAWARLEEMSALMPNQIPKPEGVDLHLWMQAVDRFGIVEVRRITIAMIKDLLMVRGGG